MSDFQRAVEEATREAEFQHALNEYDTNIPDEVLNAAMEQFEQNQLRMRFAGNDTRLQQRMRYLSELEEVGPPMRSWPRHFQHLVFVPHVRNSDRFGLVIFLLSNGYNPAAIDRFMFHGFNFNRAAQRQIADILRQWQTDRTYPNRWSAWDVQEGRTIQGTQATSRRYAQPRRRRPWDWWRRGG